MLDEHISRSPRQEMARLSEMVHNAVSNLSALQQAFNIVRFHRPKPEPCTIQEAVIFEEGKAYRFLKAPQAHNDFTSVLQRRRNGYAPENRIQMLMKNPLEAFLKTQKPSESRLNEKWLEQDRAQRAAAKRVWEPVRVRMRQLFLESRMSQKDIDLYMKTLFADSDPSHIASVQADHEEILARIAAKNAPKPKLVSDPVTQTQWDSETKLGTLNLQPKIKVKTRSEKEEHDLSLTNLSIREEGAPHPEEFKVALSKRSLETLQSLFPNRNFEERTKNIDWNALVNAMDEAGFAARQLNGSAYSFEPGPASPWSECGRIAFHRPHPEPKYESWRLLGIGKRMSKWFGWNLDTFVLN